MKSLQGHLLGGLNEFCWIFPDTRSYTLIEATTRFYSVSGQRVLQLLINSEHDAKGSTYSDSDANFSVPDAGQVPPYDSAFP